MYPAPSASAVASRPPVYPAPTASCSSTPARRPSARRPPRREGRHHAERLGGYLSDSSADRILSDVEDFGRRQPLAVIGLGVAVGFVASRFLKASSRERYQGRFSSASGALAAPATGVPAMPATGGPAMPVAVPPPGGQRERRMSSNAQPHNGDPRDQSIGELVKDLASETSTLVR